MKKISIVHIIHQAGRLTESTPNLTIHFFQKMYENSYVFSMTKPLYLRGTYRVMYLPPYQYFTLSPFIFLCKHSFFCMRYLFSRKSLNSFWIKTNVINLIRLIHLFHFIQKKNITHINCFFGNIGEFFAPLKKLLDIKVLVSFHGMDTSSIFLNHYTLIKKYGDAFFVLADHMKHDLVRAGFREDLVFVVKTGLDFSNMPLNQISTRKKQILFVGRLVEKKAILDAIEAFAIISKTYKDYGFIVVGDGPLKQRAQLIVKEYSLEKQIVFLGKQMPEKVYQLMLESKLFFLPSKTASNGDKEGAPVSIIEAQILGLPIVSTYHAGIPEVVLENKTALLSKEGDIPHMARNIEQLLEDDQLWDTFSQTALCYAKNHYNITNRMKKIKNILKKI